MVVAARKTSVPLALMVALAWGSSQAGEPNGMQRPTAEQRQALPAVKLRLWAKPPVSMALLNRLVANRYVKEYLPKVLPAIEALEGKSGLEAAVKHLADSTNYREAKGFAFEVIGGAALGDRLQQMSFTPRGKPEQDGRIDLSKGSVTQAAGMNEGRPTPTHSASISSALLSFKSLGEDHTKQLDHARFQFGRDLAPGERGFLVLGYDGALPQYEWELIHPQLAGVIAMNHKTLEQTELYRAPAQAMTSHAVGKRTLSLADVRQRKAALQEILDRNANTIHWLRSEPEYAVTARNKHAEPYLPLARRTAELAQVNGHRRPLMALGRSMDHESSAAALAGISAALALGAETLTSIKQGKGWWNIFQQDKTRNQVQLVAPTKASRLETIIHRISAQHPRPQRVILTHLPGLALKRSELDALLTKYSYIRFASHELGSDELMVVDR